MPDHIHLVAPAGCQNLFESVLRAFYRQFGVRFDLREAVPLSTSAITMRAMRYGFYNPVRKGVSDDPWAWGLSTLRDLAGAVHPVWTDAEDVARRLEVGTRELVLRATVSADLRPVPPRVVPIEAASWGSIVQASASALRMMPETVAGTSSGGKLITQLYRELNPRSIGPLRERLGIAASTIRRRCEVPHPALPAARLCLADPRLR